MKVNQKVVPRTNFFRDRPILSSLVIFICLCILLLVAINWPAFIRTAQYTVTPPPHAVADSAQSGDKTSEPDGITIAKISTVAPILWNVPLEDITSVLSSGVAHVAGTALPGEVGNAVLIGHSSDYSWNRDTYAAVFALIPHLESGDTVQLVKDGTAYTYTVTSKKVVRADDLSVLQPSAAADLTLITCYPIGTAWKRYVVSATYVGTPKLPASGEKPAVDLSGLNFR